MTRDRVDKHVVEYEVAQFKELVSFLEQQTRQKFDQEKLKEVMNLSDEATRLAWEITKLQTMTIPCPSGLEDAAYMLYPLDCLIGTQESVDFFRAAKEELEARVAKGESALPEEKYRLMLSGNLPYYALGVLSYPHKYGAIFVGDPLLTLTFSNPMIPLDLDRPLETLARKYMGYWLNLSFEKHVDWQDYFVRECNIDGIVYLTQRGCKIASSPLPYLKTIAEEKYGMPTLLMEMEQADPRDYSPVKVASQLDSFIEVVAARKEERKKKGEIK
jgi:benzoyl-CoA reductase/2-hydroxyglutaryl-CoA dehydratase subunit BcrC/BadD/HgdB